MYDHFAFSYNISNITLSAVVNKTPEFSNLLNADDLSINL